MRAPGLPEVAWPEKHNRLSYFKPRLFNDDSVLFLSDNMKNYYYTQVQDVFKSIQLSEYKETIGTVKVEF